MVERSLIHLKWVGERLWFDSTPGDWSRPVKQQGPYCMRWRVMRRQVRFLSDQPLRLSDRDGVMLDGRAAGCKPAVKATEFDSQGADVRGQ